MHQNYFNAHALNHGEVLGEVGQLARSDGFTRNANDKSLVAKLVNVGCDRTKPRNKGKVKYGGHGQSLGRESVALSQCIAEKSPWGALSGFTGIMRILYFGIALVPRSRFPACD